jgi:hypothetical protein
MAQSDAMSSHRIQSVGISTPKQLRPINTAPRKKQESKYNYSISASDIDQETLSHFLSREFGKNFRVKVSFERLFHFCFLRPNEAKP